MKYRLFVLIIAVAWFYVTPAAAQYAFQDFAVPGSVSTSITTSKGNNIFGTYTDSSGIFRGFVYDGANFSTIIKSGACYVVPYGMIGSNIVGWYEQTCNAGDFYGFIYDGQNFTTIDTPPWNSAIVTNTSGNYLVGYCRYYNWTSNSRAFLYDMTTRAFLDVAPPNSIASSANGMSGNIVAGNYVDANNQQYVFLYDIASKQYTYLPFQFTVYSIDGSNIVGYQFGNDNRAHGILYDGNSLNTIDYQGALHTQLHGITGSTITGIYYTSAGGDEKSFIATPNVPPATPSITVTYPKGGEVLYKGTAYSIQWAWSDYTGNIRVHVFKDDAYYETIAADIPVSYGTAGITFNPPSNWASSDKYEIRISTIDNQASDESDGYFTIRDMSTNITINQNAATNNQKFDSTRTKTYEFTLSETTTLAILSAGPLDLKGSLRDQYGKEILANSGYNDSGSCNQCSDTSQTEKGNDQVNIMLRAKLGPGQYTVVVTPETNKTKATGNFSIVYLKRPENSSQFFAGIMALLNDGDSSNDYFDIYVKALYPEYYTDVNDITASSNYGKTICYKRVCKERQCKALTNFYLSHVLGVPTLFTDEKIRDNWMTFTDADRNCVADYDYVMTGNGYLVFHGNRDFGPARCGSGKYCYSTSLGLLRGNSCKIANYGLRGDIFVQKISQQLNHYGIIYDGDHVIDANVGSDGMLRMGRNNQYIRDTDKWKVARPR